MVSETHEGSIKSYQFFSCVSLIFELSIIPLMRIDKYTILSSISFGVAAALVSTFSTFGNFFPQEPSLIAKILLWNVTLSVYLIGTGWLPSCKNCELAVLLYVLGYAFIIGLIGYTIAFLCVTLLIRPLAKFRI